MDFISHDNKMLLTFEAQPNRTYILWNSSEVSSENWIEVKQFEPTSEMRKIYYEIPSKRLNLPKEYYRLTIPAKVD